MKLFALIIGSAILCGCASNSSPSIEKVENSIKYSVVYEITPNEAGQLVDISVVRVTDLRTREVVQKEFSEKFLNESRSILGNGKWKVSKDEDGNIRDVYMFCYYSEAVPDAPICDAKFGG